MSEPVWLTFGFAVTVVAPPGRRRDVMLARDKAPFAIPEIEGAPLVARATRSGGRIQEWRAVDGVLHRQLLDNDDVAVPSLKAMLDLADSGKFWDYPIRSDGMAGPGNILHAGKYEWYRTEFKVVATDREKALAQASAFVADRLKLIDGVPYVQCDAPAWGIAHPLFPGQPARCTLVYDRDAPGAPLLTMPIDRREDALAVGRRLAARFLGEAQPYEVPATHDDMPEFEVVGRLPEFDRKDDIRRTWERRRDLLGDLPFRYMTPRVVDAIRSMDAAHDAMWVDGMPYSDAVQRMEDLFRVLPVNPPSSGAYESGRLGLGEILEVHRIVVDFESEYDAEDREVLSMGLNP